MGSGFWDSWIFGFLSSYAYEPWMVYGFTVLFMIACSFGLPIPEEVLIVSIGLIAFVGVHPDQFPPPHGTESFVNPYTAAAVAFFAVFLSDLWVFYIGKRLGKKIEQTKFFKRSISDERWAQVCSWMEKFGFWAAGLFRFLPGLRFPGHLACGFSKVRPTQFILVDGAAALLTVPTQILLISYFGHHVVNTLEEFKFYLPALLGLAVLSWLAIRFRNGWFPPFWKGLMLSAQKLRQFFL